MSLTIKIFKNEDWQDISDYIHKISTIPYLAMNRDWTPTSENFSCSVSVTCPFIPQLFDKVIINYGLDVIFAGFISAAPLNQDNHCYDIQVSHNLKKLQNTKVEYASTIGQYAIENTGTSIFYIIDLLKGMFTLSGLTLDCSLVENAVCFHDLLADKDILYSDFYTFEPVLYCINQSVAVQHEVIDDTINNNYNGSKITFYDYLSEICSAFTLGVQVSGYDTFKLIPRTSNYVKTDNETWSYKIATILAEYEDANVCFNLWGVNYGNYTGNTPYTSPSGKTQSGLGAFSLSWLSNNWIFWNTGTKTNMVTGGWLIPEACPYDGKHLNLDGTFTDMIQGLVPNPVRNKFIANCANYTEETIETDIDVTPLTVQQNFIDYNSDKRISKIVQQTYDVAA